MGSRKFIAVVVTVLALALSACSSSKKATTTPSTGAGGSTTSVAAASGVTVQAGINDPKAPQVAVLAFMPARVTVPVGEPVHWSWDGTTEPHTVTFFPAGQAPPSPDKSDPFFAPTPPTGPVDGKTLVNSGLQPSGPTAAKPLDLTFASPGTYAYYCVIHPQMIGSVKVVAAGQKGDTPAEAMARGAQEQQDWSLEGEAALNKLKAAAPATTKNSDGSTTWRIEMGASTLHTDVLAFGPVPAKVKTGDKVTFINNSTAPHTASFFNKQPPVLDPSDPKATSPAPGPSPQKLDLINYFNTGLLPPNAPPGSGPPEAIRIYTFIIPQNGTYSYVCIFHSPSGMVGQIVAT